MQLLQTLDQVLFSEPSTKMKEKIEAQRRQKEGLPPLDTNNNSNSDINSNSGDNSEDSMDEKDVPDVRDEAVVTEEEKFLQEKFGKK